MRREHGSGTYVRERPALRNNLERNFGVTSLIESFGLEPGRRGAQRAARSRRTRRSPPRSASRPARR